MENRIVKIATLLSFPIFVVIAALICYFLIDWQGVSGWVISYTVLCIIITMYSWEHSAFLVYMDDWARDVPYTFEEILSDQKDIYTGLFVYAPVFLLMGTVFFGVVYGLYRLFFSIIT